MDALLSHPIVGASWEGPVIESLLALAPAGTTPSFYRTNAGAEIDLMITWPNGEYLPHVTYCLGGRRLINVLAVCWVAAIVAYNACGVSTREPSPKVLAL